VSIAFLCWIAWSIASAPVGAPETTANGAQPASRPLGFLGGAAFQWVNPKAWMICVGAVGTYVPADAGIGLLAAMAATCALVTYASGGLWVVFGRALREALRTPGRRRAFNLAMAGLLVASVVPVVRG
jgi:threonine/homoserine/homoserine lactone efflux protein